MFVKTESASKLPIDNEESCSQIFSAKSESLSVYSFLVKIFNIGTKNLEKLYVGVCKADRIGLNVGQPSTTYKFTLQNTYIVPGLFPTGFIELPISFDILLEST